MPLKRRALFVTTSLATAMAIAAACGFPEPRLLDDELAETGTTESGGNTPDGGDGAVPKEASLFDSIFAIDGNENVDPDGASQEAGVAPEAGPPIDASSCADPCDCDEDKFRSNDASCPNPGRDCNDLDPFIPHDGFVSSKPVGHNGDWDCNGVVTKQFPVNFSCGLLADCTASGFKTDPGCGETGEYVLCTEVILTGVCIQSGTEARAQGCR